jgi:predicted HicB family RNase H-like nuclease
MKHINLRVPDDLHAALAAAAEDDRRSLNSMIIVMIEQSLQRRSGSARPEGDGRHSS